MGGVVEQDAASGPRRARLVPAERRRRLVDVAGQLLAESGTRGVSIGRVARAGGVTRPVVYRFFANRDAVLIAVLEHYTDSLRRRFRTALAIAPDDMLTTLRALVSATCDSIEEHGVGAWRLLAAGGPSPQVDGVATRLREELVRPWSRRIRHATGVSSTEVLVLRQMLVSSTHAVLSLWADAKLGRRAAERELLRGLSALVREYDTSRVGVRPVRRSSRASARSRR